jgi:hypothetical protein
MNYPYHELASFTVESNRIENIHKPPCHKEVDELRRFINLPAVTIGELVNFVKVYEPDAQLRDAEGFNVRVGKYTPPRGSPAIRAMLTEILNTPFDAYELHTNYELLHPFTDGNGRSGRALWAWKHKDISNGFLMPFYFQTLQKLSKDNHGSM